MRFCQIELLLTAQHFTQTIKTISQSLCIAGNLFRHFNGTVPGSFSTLKIASGCLRFCLRTSFIPDFIKVFHRLGYARIDVLHICRRWHLHLRDKLIGRKLAVGKLPGSRRLR